MKTTRQINIEDKSGYFFNDMANIRKNIFACLFSVHNTISLSRHEQVCLMRLHDVINLLYYNMANINDFDPSLLNIDEVSFKSDK